MRSIFGILISLALGMVLALLSSGCALTGKCIVINEWSPWQQGSKEPFKILRTFAKEV